MTLLDGWIINKKELIVKIRTYAFIALLSAGLLNTPAFAAAKASLDQNEQKLELLPGPSAQATIEKLLSSAKECPLNTEQMFKLSLAYFANKRFGESLTIAQLGIGTTTNSHQKAVLYILVAQNYGSIGNYNDAAKAALEGQRFDPNSRELAALRIGYFEAVGDKAQALAARDHMKRIDPNAGEPVLSWEQGRPILLKTLSSIVVIYSGIKDNRPIRDLIEQIVVVWSTPMS